MHLITGGGETMEADVFRNEADVFRNEADVFRN